MATGHEEAQITLVTPTDRDAGLEKAEPATAHHDDQNIIDFDGPDDPLNPLNWNTKYKWAMVILISTVTLMSNLATIMCAPASPQILAEFDEPVGIYSTILISIWELGECVGPLMFAPLSELYGKALVYNSANVLFVIFSVGGGASRNLATVIVLRFFTGISVGCGTLNSGFVGDMFVQESRGRAISVMSFPVLLGPILGPVIGGYITQAAGWRWTFWFNAIVMGTLEIVFFLFLHEPYKVTILQRKVKRLQRETGNTMLRSRYDLDASRQGVFREAIIRPLGILFLSPIVILLSLYTCIVYAYIYIIATTITEIFEFEYNFSQGPVGLTFLGIGIGIAAGVFICGATLDWYLKRKAAKGPMKPEYRLPLLAVGGIVIPAALFAYGWTLQAHVHWIVPIISTAFVGFGLIATTIPVSSYLVDAFGIYAASAIAAWSSLRYLSGALLPLVGPPMYARLGQGWGNSVLGFIALALVPAPLLLIKYGEFLRTSSRFKVHF